MNENVKIGIFEGKKAEYNMGVLENLLVHGPLTSWEIAKQLHQKRNLVIAQEAAFYQTQKIYSVLVRKEGRLEELKRKNYIKQRDGKWYLNTPKGFAILIIEPRLASQVRPSKDRLQQLSIIPKKIKRTIEFPFGLRLQINQRQFRAVWSTFVKELATSDSLLKIAEGIKKLVQEGIDLDKISNENLDKLLVPVLFEIMPPSFKRQLKESAHTIYF